jgi:hypothetical protein
LVHPQVLDKWLCQNHFSGTDGILLDGLPNKDFHNPKK